MIDEEKLPETVPSSDPLPTQEIQPGVDGGTPTTAPEAPANTGPEDPSTGNPADNPE